MSVNFDSTRKSRTGIPEAILAEPKTNSQLKEAVDAALKIGSVLITRINTEHLEVLSNYNIEYDKFQRTGIIGDYNFNKEMNVAIVCAGTSDIYLVEEIGMCLRYFGLNYQGFYDVGVAGIHRTQKTLKSIESGNYSVIIAVAGQDGAIFPVLAGQTKLPIIAVPSSVGYGYGGKGENALMTALQSCSPGIAVMNIDNGFGAAAFVYKMLNI